MSVINAVAQLLAAGGDYLISRSVRLRSSASAYLNRTFPSAGNKNKWTYSGWFKMGIGTNFRFIGSNTTVFGAASALGELYLDGSNRLTFFQYTGGTTYSNVISTQVFRDPSAWYHIVCIYDDAQATASNRVRMFVNGSEITSFATASYPSQNFTGFINERKPHVIGAYAASGGFYGDGYLTEVNFIDGQALTPSSFGETDAVTGVWKPKKYAGTYGTNGFYLNFSDNSNNTAATIGKDYSGNGNNWTPNNISVTAGSTYDSMLDTPTPYADGGNGRGNYAVLNPLTGGSSTTSDGNLAATIAPVNGARVSTIAVTSGKWYCEMVPTTINGYFVVGIGAPYSKGWDTTQESNPNSITWASTAAGSPYIQAKGSWTFSSNTVTTSYVVNDVIGVALDLDSNTLAFYKNGVSQGSTTINTQGIPVSFLIGNSSGASNGAGYVNFGQRPFAYTPPTGFKALNTQNLPDATIKKGNAYFDSSLYTGNGTSVSVTNSGAFQPDFVWLKQRSGANQHNLMDAVRGAAYRLRTDATNAEEATPGTFTFDASGFTANTTNVSYNTSGGTYVAWQWKESVTAGFDIVTYTGNGTSGRTVAHSLGVAPAMTIIKNRSTGYWIAWHKSLASYASNLYLNTTDSVQADGNFTVLPSSTVLTLDANKSVNVNANNYVAYLFAEVAGFSKFGSYTGNGSTDGPFVYLGFRPRWLMIKRTDTASTSWFVYDTVRNTYNAIGSELKAESSAAEGANSADMDITASGFKIRVSGTARNASGGTYIFAAFAENPFKNSLAR